MEMRETQALEAFSALSQETRLRILRAVMAGEEFEHFLHSRFVGQKRFALEGGL